ncbi:MAG: hypothetical protein LBN43_05495 [Oscillospiraceae bacterium]|nr:hypothetical protein [Oscillospiraceae bacterium]
MVDSIQENIKLNLSETPFSMRGSRHMIYEDTDGLYYTQTPLAPVFSFTGSRPKGLLKIAVRSGGVELPYTYNATAFYVELVTDKGYVRFTIDESANALRIEGNVPELTFSGEFGFGEMSAITKYGVEMHLSARLVFSNRAGKFEFDDTWQLALWNNVDPVLHITPEYGKFDVVLFDVPYDAAPPEVTLTFDECVNTNAEAFERFAGMVKTIPPAWKPLADILTYSIWIGYQNAAGGEVLFNSRYTDTTAVSLNHYAASLAFNCPFCASALIDAALGSIKPGGLVPSAPGGRSEASVPLYGFAVLRLLNDNILGKLPKTRISELYTRLSDAAEWWIKNRYDGKGLFYYAYRRESGFSNPSIFAVGTPAITPDLQTYLILLTSLLIKLSELSGNNVSAEKWNKLNELQLSALISELWNGGAFVCKDYYSGAVKISESLFSFIPLLLGDRLPKDITDKLASALDDDASFVSDNGLRSESKASEYYLPGVQGCGAVDLTLNALIIWGLKDSDKHELARKYALSVLSFAKANGVKLSYAPADEVNTPPEVADRYSPAGSAVLIAIAAKALDLRKE